MAGGGASHHLRDLASPTHGHMATGKAYVDAAVADATANFAGYLPDTPAVTPAGSLRLPTSAAVHDLVAATDAQNRDDRAAVLATKRVGDWRPAGDAALDALGLVLGNLGEDAAQPAAAATNRQLAAERSARQAAIQAKSLSNLDTPAGGDIDAGGERFTDVGDPAAAGDAVTKAWTATTVAADVGTPEASLGLHNLAVTPDADIACGGSRYATWGRRRPRRTPPPRPTWTARPPASRWTK